MRLFLALMLLLLIALLGCSLSYAVVPYPATQRVNAETQTTQEIQEIHGKFQKHEQEQIQSLNAMNVKLMQVEEKQILITKENIFLKLVTIVLLIFNFILLAWLLRDFRN